ncbi:MAG: hypothetical protein ACE5E0_00595 [Terriglobia bacterium]
MRTPVWAKGFERLLRMGQTGPLRPFEVSDGAKDLTTECGCGFCCLNGEPVTCGLGRPVCEIDGSIGHLLWAVPSTGGNCPYLGSFGGEATCSCPTRNEIYRLYGK